MQTIKLRSMGSDVVLLQQLLNKWGYKVDETGLFDEQTDIMVRDFQRKNKLAVDGIVGKGTCSKRKLLPVLQVGDCSRLWGSTMRHADVRMRESLSRRCVPTKEVNSISSRHS